MYTTHLSDEAVDLYSLDLTQSVAFVFGNETFGVSDDIRRFSDGDFIIPQIGIIKSLNISVACAVTLYEAFSQKKAKGHYLDSRMPQGQAEAISAAWGIK